MSQVHAAEARDARNKALVAQRKRTEDDELVGDNGKDQGEFDDSQADVFHHEDGVEYTFQALKRITSSAPFNNFITAVVVIAGNAPCRDCNPLKPPTCRYTGRCADE